MAVCVGLNYNDRENMKYILQAIAIPTMLISLQSISMEQAAQQNDGADWTTIPSNPLSKKKQAELQQQERNAQIKLQYQFFLAREAKRREQAESIPNLQAVFFNEREREYWLEEQKTKQAAMTAPWEQESQIEDHPFFVMRLYNQVMSNGGQLSSDMQAAQILQHSMSHQQHLVNSSDIHTAQPEKPSVPASHDTPPKLTGDTNGKYVPPHKRATQQSPSQAAH